MNKSAKKSSLFILLLIFAALASYASGASDTVSYSQTGSESGGTMYIKVNGNILTAELAANSSAAALKELLSNTPLTIEMEDYGKFEKVGSLGTSLPTNDEQITTEAGDLILYLGTRFVIYYDTNDWNFTRLGKIKDITQSELKSILGTGDVTVTLSLEK